MSEENKQQASSPRVTSISVEWGDEYHQPIQFNGFHTGTVGMTVDVPDGVPAIRVHAWAMKQLKAMHQKQFDEKFEEYNANNRTARR